MTENPAVAQARELVLAYGWNSTSFQIVNPGIKRWFSDNGDAVVGYVHAGPFRVVAGAPVCALDKLNDVIGEFESDARGSHQKVCYFGAESRLEEAVRNGNSHTKFLLGAQPTWNPKNWPEIVAGHKSLRAQLNRAKNKGVRVSEFDPSEARRDKRL